MFIVQLASIKPLVVCPAGGVCVDDVNLPVHIKAEADWEIRTVHCLLPATGAEVAGGLVVPGDAVGAEVSGALVVVGATVGD